MDVLLFSVILYYAFLVFVVLAVAFVILRVTRMVLDHRRTALNDKPPSGQARGSSLRDAAGP
jgi:hypothetical protein